MKKRRSPQEKKQLAYERDHYVSAGESRHAFRKNWPKKKAMANQIHRHRAAEALQQLEKLGDLESIDNSSIEVTGEELRKIDPRKKLSKWGVMSLQEYVKHNQEAQLSRPKRALAERERIAKKYKTLISALEVETDLAKAAELSREITVFDFYLYLFLKWNPEWQPRLQKKLAEICGLKKKAQTRHEKKEAEKASTRAIHKAIQKRATDQSK